MPASAVFNLAKDCLIVNIQIGMWEGHRLDKETTARITREASASPDAGRFNKHLIAKEHLVDVKAAAAMLRVHFYKDTLPWKDNGDRLLVRKMALDFIQKHEGYNTQFKAAVDEFLRNRYPTAVEQAEFRLGEMFNPDDFPSVMDLRRKFYCNLDIDGVSSAHDLRLQSNPDIIQQRVTKAIADLWGRLEERLGHFTEVMSEEDKIFRNKTVDKLRDIVELIPALNFANDEKLEEIREEIEQRLITVDPDDLRTDPMVRSSVAAEARDIMERMRGYMNAFAEAA